MTHTRSAATRCARTLETVKANVAKEAEIVSARHELQLSFIQHQKTVLKDTWPDVLQYVEDLDRLLYNS